MSFNMITEGSKNYIKHVLQLSEANALEAWHLLHPSPYGYTPERFRYKPDNQGREYSLKKNFKKDKQVPSENYGNPNTKINTGAHDIDLSPKWSSGYGGRDFPLNSQPPEDIEFMKTKPYKTKQNNSLMPTVLFGGSKLPNAKGNIAYNSGGDWDSDDSGGLDYLTAVAQGTSIVDYADQMLPAAAKLALSAALFGQKVKKTPSDDDQDLLSGFTSSNNPMADSFQRDVINKVKQYAGGKNLGPLGDKVMKFSQNLGALDPLNPLLGLKLGYEMLGGNEILKRTREIGSAQSSGAQSSMGHPSGFGYYGR